MTEEASMFEQENEKAAGLVDRESRRRTCWKMDDGPRGGRHRWLRKDRAIFGKQRMGIFGPG